MMYRCSAMRRGRAVGPELSVMVALVIESGKLRVRGGDLVDDRRIAAREGLRAVEKCARVGASLCGRECLREIELVLERRDRDRMVETVRADHHIGLALHVRECVVE